jgi:hypothetical protein
MQNDEGAIHSKETTISVEIGTNVSHVAKY